MDNYFNNIERVLSLRNIKMNEHLFHTEVFLEYDCEEALIFLTPDLLFFTNIIHNQDNEEKLMYVISYDKVR